MRSYTSKQCQPAMALRPLFWGAAAALLVHASLALAQADRLEFDALVQEGDLILEEVAVLQPALQKLAKEGKQIAQADQTVRDEGKAVETGIKQFNASMEALSAGAKEQNEQCPRQIEDPVLLESCNTRAKQLVDLQQTLAQQRAPLLLRQQELNARIEKHNAASKDYAKRDQEVSQRDMLNQHDAEDWLGRARAFLASERVTDFLTSIGDPAACSSERLAELAKLAAVPALKRAQACLKAIKAAAR